MKILRILFIVVISFSSLVVSAQPYFQRNDDIQVNINGNFIKFPWAGGLNFIQASNIDLNMDGVKDLFIFDRTGNKIRTFVNNGIAGAANYSYAPEWENFFPYLHDWVLLADYNCDGKEDIFSFADLGGGIKVYKNVSTTQFGLQFELVDTLLRSVFNPDANPPFNNPINLFVTSVDIPSISDIDNDGDVDIITFAINGSCLEYHQNQSQEDFHTCDSLKFKMKNRGWGFGSESPISNVFILNDTCANNVLNPGIQVDNNPEGNRSTDRHAGNCELCMDLDGDADKEIIIGNIYFNTLSMITNGGSPLLCNFVANDVDFPLNNGTGPAVDLALMPCAFKVDVNNDGINDIMVSPNVPNQSENFNSVLYYKNVGTNSFPSFQFQQSNFLQDSMIDVGEGAYPVFFDYDNDGLQDLFIGNANYYDTTHHGNQIAQFHNTGTTAQPKFELITRDYDNMSQLTLVNMIPTFGDLDGDGDADMIVGSDQGKIHYFQNIAPAGGTAQFALSMPNLRNTLNHYIDVGYTAAPQLVDIDGDGKKDLVIGGSNGKLLYLHHAGTGTETVPLFDSVTNYFGHVNVKEVYHIWGYSYPCVFKEGGITKMLVGDDGGHVRLYDSIDSNLSGYFNQVDSTFLGIFQGTRTAPNVADIDNDGLLDMALGNYEGGVTYYKGVSSLNGINEVANKFTWTFNLFPNPANDIITIKINNDIAAVGYTIELSNVMGQKIISEKTTTNTFTINTQNFAAGMYFCKVSEIKTDGSIKSGSLIKKLVIQH